MNGGDIFSAMKRKLLRMMLYIVSIGVALLALAWSLGSCMSRNGLEGDGTRSMSRPTPIGKWPSTSSPAQSP